MKHTDFRFELRVAPDNRQAALGGLEATLLALNGVNSVSASGSESVVELTVNASFEGAEQAKKLHRKVMQTIMASEGTSISQMGTTLTDIF